MILVNVVRTCVASVCGVDDDEQRDVCVRALKCV